MQPVRGTGTQRSLGAHCQKQMWPNTLYIFILTNLFFYSICFISLFNTFYVFDMDIFPLLLKINPKGPIQTSHQHYFFYLGGPISLSFLASLTLRRSVRKQLYVRMVVLMMCEFICCKREIQNTSLVPISVFALI